MLDKCIDKKKLLDDAVDFYQIYMNGGIKWIKLDGYFYDEGQDNGSGTSRIVEYSGVEAKLYDFIKKMDDEDYYDYYTEGSKQFMQDMSPEEAFQSMERYYGDDILIKPLKWKELNMMSEVGYYVNI